MAAVPSGADELANDLLDSLTEGVEFTIPEVDFDDPAFDIPPATGDMYLPVTKLTTADLTTGMVGGAGMFDQLMVSLAAHLKVEYTANRIAGAEYTKAYIGVIAAALQTAQQYLLAKDQSYWQAILVQQQARIAEIEVVKARVELETAKALLARTQFEAHNAEAQYGLTKMQIANQDIAYAQTVAQIEGIDYTNTNILPAQKLGIDYTNTNLQSTGEGIEYTTANILPAQKALLTEQTEVQNAQISDTQIEGAVAVSGLIGKQKLLYTQQIDSYKRDAETKLVKQYTDAWLTQKTIDEGYPLPAQFANTEIDEILIALRTNLGLGS
jgi:hypothetical protein